MAAKKHTTEVPQSPFKWNSKKHLSFWLQKKTCDWLIASVMEMDWNSPHCSPSSALPLVSVKGREEEERAADAQDSWGLCEKESGAEIMTYVYTSVCTATVYGLYLSLSAS